MVNNQSVIISADRLKRIMCPKANKNNGVVTTGIENTQYKRIFNLIMAHEFYSDYTVLIMFLTCLTLT